MTLVIGVINVFNASISAYDHDGYLGKNVIIN